MSSGFIVAYYGLQLAILYWRLGHLPNYVTVYDYPANVAQIVRSTPALSDMVPIILNEWLVEIAYIDRDYGHGIAEWTMAVLPAKLAVIAITSALISTSILLWRQTRASCSVLERQVTAGSTGLGALMLGLANISLSWVVCCGTPNWVVGLALLGMDSSLSFALEPFGGWIAGAGIILLATSTLWSANRELADQPAIPRPELLPEIA
jgi:hypothetical protein